jgi:hypothetical protein
MQRNPLGVDGRARVRRAGASFFAWAAAGRDAQTGMSSQHSKRPDCHSVLGSCVYICCGVGACIVLMLLSLLLLLMMIGAWGRGCIMLMLTCCGATGCGAYGAYCCSTYGCAMGTGAGTERGTCT